MSPPRLSRLYLIPAAVATILGLLAIRAHLGQPIYPIGPGFGCVVTTIPGPDTVHVPSAYLEVHACPHINETILDLHLYTPEDGGPSAVFSGSGPENPYVWSESLRVRWLTDSTVAVTHSPQVSFLYRRDEVGPVRFQYAVMHRNGG